MRLKTMHFRVEFLQELASTIHTLSSVNSNYISTIWENLLQETVLKLLIGKILHIHTIYKLQALQICTETEKHFVGGGATFIRGLHTT
jgi:hypothetical protein